VHTVFAAKDCVWEGKLGVIMEGGGYGLCGQGLCVREKSSSNMEEGGYGVCGQGLCVGGKIRSNNGRGWIRSLRSGTVCGREN